MATIQANYDHFTNPVDMVEHIATIHDWTFERSAPDELTLSVSGSWCDYHMSLTWRDDLEALHLACELGELVLEMRGLRCERFRWVLQIGRIELREIARDALLQLRPSPLDFALREVLVARVDGFELRAVVWSARPGAIWK